MIDYLRYFFDPVHLLTLRPPAMSLRAIGILVAIFGLMLAGAAASKLLIGKTKDGLKIKFYRRLTQLLTTVGLLGFVYVFFAYQRVTLLAARFILLILGVIFLVWLAFILKYRLVDAPKTRAELDRKRKFEKYLP